MRTCLAAITFCCATSAALASSEDAWDQFRKDVHDACVALAPKDGETVIEVNPFGSESYGAALIVHTVNDDAAERYVCIYDKQTKKAEITQEFTPPGGSDAESQPATGAELVE